MSVYLLILLVIIIIPLVLSFYKPLRFYSKIQNVWPQLFFVFSGFILWDVLFTQMGIWWFNPDQVAGVYIMGLPVEEILFFPAVFFSMYFVYEVLKYFYGEAKFAIRRQLFFTLSSVLFLIALIFNELTYTFVALIFVSAVVFTGAYFYYEKFRRKAYVYTILISFIPFIIFNGLLTGIPVVLYNDGAILGIRAASIPLEDFFFSFSMLTLIFLVE